MTTCAKRVSDRLERTSLNGAYTTAATCRTSEHWKVHWYKVTTDPTNIFGHMHVINWSLDARASSAFHGDSFPSFEKMIRVSRQARRSNIFFYLSIEILWTMSRDVLNRKRDKLTRKYASRIFFCKTFWNCSMNNKQINMIRVSLYLFQNFFLYLSI